MPPLRNQLMDDSALILFFHFLLLFIFLYVKGKKQRQMKNEKKTRTRFLYSNSTFESSTNSEIVRSTLLELEEDLKSRKLA